MILVNKFPELFHPDIGLSLGSILRNNIYPMNDPETKSCINITERIL